MNERNNNKMDKTDYEMIIMKLEISEPDIMKRMREGAFTEIEAGYIIYGFANAYLDKNRKDFREKIQRISILVEGIIGADKKH